MKHPLVAEGPRNQRRPRHMPSKSLPRVLYAVALDPALKFGSLEEQIVRLARTFELHDGLFYPLFICPEGGNKSIAFQEAGIETECLDLRSFHWARLARLLRLIARNRITLVHWNFTDMLRNSYLWWLTLLRPNVRHCYTDHISRMPGSRQFSGGLKKILKRFLLQRYDKVFCVSQFVLNDLRRQQIRSDLILCRYFINAERFRPDQAMRADLRRQLHVEGSFVLLTVAHLIKEKGIDVVIRALTELPDSVVLWIVGDGDESERLHQLCSELRLTSRVFFQGLQKNVAPLMQAADCFVCPSLWSEAAGLVNLEASASGLPVIASRIGGIPEFVEEGRTGFLFTPGDYRELIRCVQFLNEDPGLCQKMSVQTRARAMERFAPDVRVPEYLDLYRA